MAVERGQLAPIRTYIDAEGDLLASESGRLQRTLLHVAADRRRTKVAQLLLATRSDAAFVDAGDYRGYTALHLACSACARGVVEALLDAGADPRAQNTFGDVALHALAQSHGGNTSDLLAVAGRLIEAGCPVDGFPTSADYEGRTPLWFTVATGTVPEAPAVRKAKLALARRLLEAGANPSARSALGGGLSVIDAARGLHQTKRYRHVWPEAVALLESAISS